MQCAQSNQPPSGFLAVFSALFGEFLYYSVAAVIPFIAVYIDLYFFNNMIHEESCVEYTQECFLFIITLLLFNIARQKTEYRAGFILFAGFTATMLIREFDNIFDNLIRHGAWSYFALATALGAIGYALKNKRTVVPGLYFFAQSKEYGSFIASLIMLLISARLLGKTSIWMHVLGESYVRVAKHLVEEGSELLSYSFMLFALMKFYYKVRRRIYE